MVEFVENVNKAVQIKEDITAALEDLKNAICLYANCSDGSGFSQQAIKAGNQKIANMFKEAYIHIEELVNSLTNLVKEWQAKFKLYYAKLMKEPDLEQIPLWCAKVGEILEHLLHESLHTWYNIIQRFPAGQKLLQTEYETLQSAFKSLMLRFMKSTFIVCEQGEFFIKGLKKCFPKFYVRVLAADYLPKYLGEVTAHCVAESDLTHCFHGDDIDIDTLKEEELNITCSEGKKKNPPTKFEVKSVEGNDRMECRFDNLQFVDKFKRKQNRKDIKVHEEKFRIVFVTYTESKSIWTLSLPLVIITASNQEVASLASIMWQCFSTNVFSLNEEMPTELPWSSVAEMLVTKMSVISTSPSHTLTDDNITHLKNRLFGIENQADDTPVSLTQFCCNPMKDTQGGFSFWKWFLGSYNLIEGHLSKYWSDGLIMGFVKRTDAEKMLLTCNRSGTFLLRFSDSLLTDKDGYKNVCGQLVASILNFTINGTAVEPGNKRNALGQQEFEVEKVIEHVKIDECTQENLANILKDEPKSLYQFIYPSLKPRSDLFDRYYKKKESKSPDGYKNTKDLPCLEQGIRDMNLVQDVNNDSEPRIKKKARRTKESSEQTEFYGRKQTDSFTNVPTQQQSPLNSSQNSFQMSQVVLNADWSPAQSVPESFTRGLVTSDLNKDSVVPESHVRSNLPRFIEEENACLSEKMSIRDGTSESFTATPVLPAEDTVTVNPFCRGTDASNGEVFQVNGTIITDDGFSVLLGPDRMFSEVSEIDQSGQQLWRNTEQITQDSSNSETDHSEECEGIDASVSAVAPELCFHLQDLQSLLSKETRDELKQKLKPDEYINLLLLVKENISREEPHMSIRLETDAVIEDFTLNDDAGVLMESEVNLYDDSIEIDGNEDDMTELKSDELESILNGL